MAVKDIKRRVYTVTFKFIRDEDKLAAEGRIIHACVDYHTRKAVPLPVPLVRVLHECS